MSTEHSDKEKYLVFRSGRTPKAQVAIIPTPTTEMAGNVRPGEEQTGNIGLMDGKQNYKRQPRQAPASRGCSSSRLWVFFAVLFFLTTVGAIAALIWRHSFYKEPDTRTDGQNNTRLQRFAGFFRSPEEQEVFARETFRFEAKESIRAREQTRSNRTCNLYCGEGNPFQKPPINGSFSTTRVPQALEATPIATLGDISYNGCCQTQTYFQSPDTAEGIDGLIKVLATDGDRRQFFRTQDCKHVIGCSGCTCTRIMETFTAVIDNTELDDDDDFKYIITAIKLLGCCKCLNA